MNVKDHLKEIDRDNVSNIRSRFNAFMAKKSNVEEKAIPAY
jgi:hypothetical protein